MKRPKRRKLVDVAEVGDTLALLSWSGLATSALQDWSEQDFHLGCQVQNATILTYFDALEIVKFDMTIE